MFIGIFLLGLLIFSYPLISQKYYEIQKEDEVITFVKAAKALPPENLDKRMALAEAYNKTLDPSRLADPYTDIEKAARADYARMLEVEEMVGHINIPKIGVDIPIRAGSSDDVLQKVQATWRGRPFQSVVSRPTQLSQPTGAYLMPSFLEI